MTRARAALLVLVSRAACAYPSIGHARRVVGYRLEVTVQMQGMDALPS